MARCSQSWTKCRRLNWLTLKEKMKVVDELKRAKPVMDVAAEFGVVLCYYSRPCKQLVLHNDMDVCYPHKYAKLLLSGHSKNNCTTLVSNLHAFSRSCTPQ